MRLDYITVLLLEMAENPLFEDSKRLCVCET